jgi:hypothetical protein
LRVVAYFPELSLCAAVFNSYTKTTWDLQTTFIKPSEDLFTLPWNLWKSCLELPCGFREEKYTTAREFTEMSENLRPKHKINVHM